ncbi:TPR-like protein [Pleomassaria siparia CBS 279.74]|uniref:TPR-like protein n=1 Tax=Pleomassaria siparia CBS 279.74 TaxID=1314801 RepID=A0A6G1K7U0_9PLEO|nr:TPR-like protein [Pleomassaria siparia CBS 279.74]
MVLKLDPYYNLGTYRRNVSTTKPEVQTWFDRGLIWSYAFHHEEAARCFEKAISADPKCAMAYWGLAYALGPNYNKPWELFDEAELKAMLDKINAANKHAEKNADGATEAEGALIHAIQARVPKTLDDIAFRACNEAYADAMTTVYNQFPDDLDVASLYADALMNLSAWNLWDLRTGEPTPGSRSLEAKAVLEKGLAHPDANTHPGLLHLYVHLMEMSKTPEAAVVAGDHLRTLCPDAGHLVHMPSHLDILIGDYRRAIASNLDACIADERYLSHRGGANFYTFYRLHNYHTLIYAAMFAGQYKVAMEVVGRLEASIPESVLRIDDPPMADFFENFVSVRIHVLVRFGRWEEILALKHADDKDLYCVTTAMLHYGRGIAFSATGELENANVERDWLHDAVDLVKPTRIAGDFPNKARVVLQVAKAMLDGELEYRKGNYDEAFKHLRTSIERDDNLVYGEPWPWMQPTRHAYAALLMEQGHVEEAAKAYAADLGFDDTLPRARQHPNNVWALHGYHECLVKLGRKEEAVIIGQQLVLAQAVADIPINASCYCRGAGNS